MSDAGSTVADEISRSRVLLIDFDGSIWDASAGPAAGLIDLVRAASARGWRVGVVSNLDSDLIFAYMLADEDLRQYVDGQAARVDSLDPSELMPNPLLIRAGLTAATHRSGVPSTDAVLISSTEHAVQAARAAGVSVIGYAVGTVARERLVAAGADAITETLGELAVAVASPPG